MTHVTGVGCYGDWYAYPFLPQYAEYDAKNLSQLLGSPDKSADVRPEQYETGVRNPKADLTSALANAPDISPLTLSMPDIDSYHSLMNTLFIL